MIRLQQALLGKWLGTACVILSIFLLSGGVGVMLGQDEPIRATAAVTSESVRIGDVIEYQVRVEYAPDLVVQMPGAQTTFGDFEVRGVEVSPPIETEAGQYLATAKFQLMVFKTGELEIPSVDIPFTTQAGDESTVSTGAVAITILSTITDETQDIEDIKPPRDMPRSWWLVIILVTVGLLLAAGALYWWLRKRRVSSQPGGTWVDPRPAHEIALEALQQLRESKLLDRQEVGRFHVEASEIIRRYLEGRFGLEAMEMTTGEVLEDLDRGRLHLKEHAQLGAFLGQCDMVKFAKLLPERSRSEDLLVQAVAFVEATRPPRRESMVQDAEPVPDQGAPIREAGQGTTTSNPSKPASGEEG